MVQRVGAQHPDAFGDGELGQAAAAVEGVIIDRHHVVGHAVVGYGGGDGECADGTCVTVPSVDGLDGRGGVDHGDAAGHEGEVERLPGRHHGREVVGTSGGAYQHRCQHTYPPSCSHRHSM